MQPPGVVMKSKARILIDVSDVLFKTVLTHRVAPSDATLIAFKILEVGVLHHSVLHYLHTRPINLHPDMYLIFQVEARLSSSLLNIIRRQI